MIVYTFSFPLDGWVYLNGVLGYPCSPLILTLWLTAYVIYFSIALLLLFCSFFNLLVFALSFAVLHYLTSFVKFSFMKTTNYHRQIISFSNLNAEFT